MVRKVLQNVQDVVDGDPLQPISVHDIRVALKQMKALRDRGSISYRQLLWRGCQTQQLLNSRCSLQR
eukprot:2433373-Pyramimonas_sp.AAC.1